VTSFKTGQPPGNAHLGQVENVPAKDLAWEIVPVKDPAWEIVPVKDPVWEIVPVKDLVWEIAPVEDPVWEIAPVEDPVWEIVQLHYPKRADHPGLVTVRGTDHLVPVPLDTYLRDLGLRVIDHQAIVRLITATGRTTVVVIGDVFRTRTGAGTVTRTIGGRRQRLWE